MQAWLHLREVNSCLFFFSFQKQRIEEVGTISLNDLCVSSSNSGIEPVNQAN